MPNGQLQGGDLSAAQGTLLVPDPGSAARYYLFSVDAVENNLAAGFRYSVVDMRLNNGLGDVLLPHSQRLTPIPNFQCTEGLTAVCDRSQTGYWIVVHRVNTSDFYAYHLQASGFAAVPTLSTTGSIHSNNFTTRQPAANVLLRASPNGRILAAGVPGEGFELFDFDNATSQVSNPRRLPLALIVPYGVEFSDDNTKIYLSDISRGTLYQYDLAAPAALPMLIADQGSGNIGGLQRGTDGRIYVARANAMALGVIINPNLPGTACNYQPAAVSLGAVRGYLGLPNFPNAWLRSRRGPQLLSPAAVCAGGLVTFGVSPMAVGTAATWNFGEPASGPANVAQGSPVQHRYAGPGTYRVQLILRTDSSTVGLVRTVTVEPPVALRLLPLDTVLCSGSSLTLRLSGYLPGSTFAWSDGGPALPERLIRTGAGRYTVRVISPAGCETTASATVAIRTCAPTTVNIPNIITPNGDNQNQTFILKGLNPSDWQLHVYNRWGREIYQQEKYDNTWSAQGQPDGAYYYLLTNATTNQKLKGWLEVRR